VTYNFEGMQKAMTYAGVTIGFRLLLSAVLHTRDQRQNIGGGSTSCFDADKKAARVEHEQSGQPLRVATQHGEGQLSQGLNIAHSTYRTNVHGTNSQW
jgi:hypothetical protein